MWCVVRRFGEFSRRHNYAVIRNHYLELFINSESSVVRRSRFSTSNCINMKLLTHNMLTSKCMKGVQEGYPLRLKVEDLEVKETDYNQEFLVRLLPKINYAGLYSAAKDIGKGDSIPAEAPADAGTSEEFLKKLHHILLEIEIQKGELICPETGRTFPIQNGIPNMLLKPEETN